MQDVVERAWRARHQLRTLEAVDAWLRSALLNRARDLHRRGMVVTFTSLDSRATPIAAPEGDVADALLRAERAAAVRVALRTLKASELLAVVLCDAEGWRAVDVAIVTGTSSAAIHKRLQRGRAHLRDAVAINDGVRVATASAPCDPVLALAAGYLEGTLDAVAIVRVETHLAICSRCPPLVSGAE